MSTLHRDAIIKKLDDTHVTYKHFEHAPVTTSQHASEIRGVPLSSGAKALVLADKKSGANILVVIPADKKIDFDKLKNVTGNKYSFASNPENVVGCVPGSVPPFGSVLGLQTYADTTLADTLNFNIGLLTESVSLSKQDFFTTEQPIEGDFIKE